MKTQPLPKVSLTTLSVRQIYALTQQFCQLHPKPTRRGRPPIYPEALILTLVLMRTLHRASYRQLRHNLGPDMLPGEPLPSLSTLIYRALTISDER